MVCYDEVMKRLKEDLILVNSDIRNNNDAARLQKFGSETLEEGISRIFALFASNILKIIYLMWKL